MKLPYDKEHTLLKPPSDRKCATSVIICTKNRVQPLIKCLRSVIAQSISPSEIIIVDAGNTEKAYSEIQAEFPQDPRFKYIHTFPSYLTVDRNIGVMNSSGDIVVFLDDDVILDKDFIKETIQVFQNDYDGKVGGVTGRIISKPKPNNIRVTLHFLIARIFLLPRSGNGNFKASGSPTWIDGAKEIKQVEFLSGVCMAYRKGIFDYLKFDEHFLSAHLYLDDEDFSYRVSREYKNIYTPYAKLVHTRSSIERENPTVKAMRHIKSRYYLVKKNFPHKFKYTLAFWWSIAGYLIQAIMSMDKKNIGEMLDGVNSIKKPPLHARELEAEIARTVSITHEVI